MAPRVMEYARIDREDVVYLGAVTVYFGEIEGRIDFNKKPMTECRFSVEREVIDRLTPEVTARFGLGEGDVAKLGDTFDAGGSGHLSLLDMPGGERMALYGFTYPPRGQPVNIDTLSMEVFEAILTAFDHVERHEPDRVLNTYEAY